MQIGYGAPTNEDSEVCGTLIVNGDLIIRNYGRVVNQGPFQPKLSNPTRPLISRSSTVK